MSDLVTKPGYWAVIALIALVGYRPNWDSWALVAGVAFVVAVLTFGWSWNQDRGERPA